MQYRKLLSQVLERTFRDVGLIQHNGKVNSRGPEAFENLLDGADFIFDDWSRDIPYSFFWILQVLPGIGDAEAVIKHAREHILNFWTLERVEEYFGEEV